MDVCNLSTRTDYLGKHLAERKEVTSTKYQKCYKKSLVPIDAHASYTHLYVDGKVVCINDDQDESMSHCDIQIMYLAFVIFTCILILWPKRDKLRK